ncbi:cytochrome c1 1, heme protein, mitochondrial-like [Panicum virgatum]|uniref:Cytochrome c domain-containing protein n=1 Tax=Panicum virgatum TaxID=38727 RepID=A0A8T0WZE5_PANVG|nr:cytochrome c1 1, heme protein, mitochondrial-like [Panicum virgatum]KAG2654891.1 hypothetical protein PVAP13_1NG561200 [Panicum virgatum]
MAAASARALASKLLRQQGNTSAHRLPGMGVGALAGFFSAAAVASASDGGNNACPAYPWPQDGARGGHKVFMQHDCAACHSMLPYAGLAEPAAGRGEMEAKVAEIVVVHEAVRSDSEPAAAATTLHGGACPPDLSVITKMLEGPRYNSLFNAAELKKRMALPLPNPVWLQFLQPYRT